MTSWYCKIDDVEHGPLSQDDLVTMVQQGRLSPGDLVRIETKEKWYKAGEVKGLKFPDEGEQRTSAENQQASAPPSSTTSVEAGSLLKSLVKKGTDKGDNIEVDSWEAADRASSKAVLSRSLERKPLDQTTKRILWLASGAILLLILFPPHQVPEDFSLPAGRHTTFLFTPPVMTLDPAKKGMGSVDNIGKIEVKTVDGVQTATVSADIPINWMRLLLECVGVIVVAALTCGFLVAKKAAGEVPAPKPTHPPQRPRRREI